MVRPARAQKIAVLVNENVKIYALIYSGIHEKVKGDIREFNLKRGSLQTLEAIQRYDPDILVAVGSKSALWAYHKVEDVPVVASGVINQSNPEIFQNMPGVSLDFPIRSYLNLIQTFIPDKRHVSVLYHPVKGKKLLDEIARSIRGSDLMVLAEKIRKQKDVSKGIQNLEKMGSKVFLVTFDPLIMNRESYKYLVQYTITRGISLIVPSKSLLKNGGLVSLEADYGDIGRQTGKIVNRILGDASLAGSLRLEPPEQKNIGVNLKVARALNIDLSPLALKKASFVLR